VKSVGDIYNILIAGIGGQGVVRLGKILREFGIHTPLIKNVVGTETRGVSQREGSVSATARYLIDSRVYSLDQGYEVSDLISPLIPINDAHLVLGLEPLETIRNLRFISEQTVVIVNTHKHYPRDVIIGAEKEKTYPSTSKIVDLLDQFARRVISMDFNQLSTAKLKSAIYANTIILGVGVREFKEIFDKKIMRNLIRNSFKRAEANLKAFDLGYNLINEF